MANTVAHPYGGTCRVAFGFAVGDRWTFRGFRVVARAHCVEITSGALAGHCFAYRRLAEDAIDARLAGE